MDGYRGIDLKLKRYDEIYPAISKIGGWANFRRFVMTQADQDFNSFVDLIQSAEEMLKTCRKTTNGPMRVNYHKVYDFQAALENFKRTMRRAK